MRGIGVHVCEDCGKVYDTLGGYWKCQESHICGAERAPDSDCWCTLPPGHGGQHRCTLCTERHGAPGWDDPEEADQ